MEILKMSNQEILNVWPEKDGKWPECNQVDSDGKFYHQLPVMRSLEDIQALVDKDKRIAELEKQNAEMVKENQLLKQVEKLFNESPDLTFDMCKRLFSDELQAHNLEQQIIGIDGFADKHLVGHGLELAIDYCEELRTQAKALKDGE